MLDLGEESCLIETWKLVRIMGGNLLDLGEETCEIRGGNLLDLGKKTC